MNANTLCTYYNTLVIVGSYKNKQIPTQTTHLICIHIRTCTSGIFGLTALTLVFGVKPEGLDCTDCCDCFVGVLVAKSSSCKKRHETIITMKWMICRSTHNEWQADLVIESAPRSISRALNLFPLSRFILTTHHKAKILKQNPQINNSKLQKQISLGREGQQGAEGEKE